MALFNRRGTRWAAAGAALLALYAALGFWAVPRFLTSQWPGLVQAHLERQGSVGEITFNPFTLRLVASDLRLAEANSAPLLSVGRLVVEMQWRSLWRRAWSFAEVGLSQPRTSFAIAPDGKLNIAEMAATFARLHPPDEADKGPPRLIVERFFVDDGRVDVQDRQAGYANEFSPITFSLVNFSTLPDQKDTHNLSAGSTGDGLLHWRGSASVNPVRGSGEVTLQDYVLPQFGVYLRRYTQAKVKGGKLNASLPYTYSYADGKFEFRVAGAKLALRELALVDEAVDPPIRLGAGEATLLVNAVASQAGDDFRLVLADTSLSMSGLSLARGERESVKLATLGFTGAAVDLTARRVAFERVFAEGASLQVARDRAGHINLLDLLPPAPPSAEAASSATAGKPWLVTAAKVELAKSSADVADEASGIKVRIDDIALNLEEAGSDLSRPVKFTAALRVHEGGELSAQGSVVPAGSALQADLRLKQLALAPLQPLLAQHVKLKIARGHVSAQGRLTANAGDRRGAGLRYAGGFDVADLVLAQEDGETFASWKSVSADRLSASLGPEQLEIPELRVVEPNARLIIEEDRRLRAMRLLVRVTDTAAQSPAAEEAFPVRIRRMRFQDAKLEFADLGLIPRFGAKIHELNGTITGLSSDRMSRSVIELDGRVDEFGQARIRGELNPFAPRNNTDVNVIFKNVDMVSVSPYSMKFAGYKIAEGKISLDLQYKVRNSVLEGSNQIVLDKLTLGERVDSPDAFKLPIELAIAILKDSDGRIDLGLPISGNIDDPQFSYGALIWKAVGNLLTRIVTAPFRALGALVGGGGEKLESIDFDAGSAKLLPPEQEKLKQVAQILGKRAQLKLSVPGAYSDEADGAALRARAVRIEVANRARIKLQPGDDPPPLDIGDRAVRSAYRAVYAERFGDAELDKQKLAAEKAAPAASSASAAASDAAPARLPIWQRVGNMVQGEPQVADSHAFYAALQQRLNQTQPLPPEALGQLATQRSTNIVEALKATGLDPSRAGTAANEKVAAEPGKLVPLKLGLTTK
ncbi:MAG: DUF748 domain-containing protein [Ramlibacter sp.]